MGTSNNSLKSYFAASKTWSQDIIHNRAVERWLAWGMAAVLGLTTLCLGGALMILMPLKSTEVVVVRVDQTTGYSEALTLLRDAPASYDENVTRYNLAHYVTMREQFAFPTREENFELVLMNSSPEVSKYYSVWFNGETSPQIVYGRQKTVKIKVFPGVNFLSDSVAVVRYEKIIIDNQTGTEVSKANYAASIAFKYYNGYLENRIRLQNPLGFIVTSYSTERELLK